jgi:16S rRNA (adenine1518-N6/adenine1519-N6)-dimethyltransferase
MIPGEQAERGWLIHHAIRPRKSLGQNFLVQPQVATGLVRAMHLAPGAEVMEVGAGAGALTRALLDAGARVWAFEIDARLCALLRERFAGPLAERRLYLSESSILEAHPALLDGASGSPVHLAGNLPYAITTPILLWAIGHRDLFSGGAVLVQREVAERLAAGPGNRTYGSITVWIGYHARVRKVLTVEPGAFWPVPNVDSSLITLDFHRAPPVELPDPSALERVLAVAFGQRRKMLRASFGGALGDPARAVAMLVEAGIDPTRRAETLNLAEFVSLARVAGEALR